MRIRLILLALALLALALSTIGASAATVYVRDGGTGNGSDWANALDQIPSPMVRGNTYWMADGTYVARAINVPLSGTSLITIKKASPSEHGTDTGWSDTYGDGEAYFTGSWDSLSGTGGYITWDGTYKYGIRMQTAPTLGAGGENAPWHIRADGASFNNVTIKYCKAWGAGHEVWRPQWGNKSHVIWIQNNQGQHNNWVLQNNWFSGVITLIIVADCNNWLIESNILSWATSEPVAPNNFHSNVIWSDDSADWHFRYNLVYMWDVEGLLMAYGTTDRIYIYGNVAVTDATSPHKGCFVQSYQTGSYTGWRVYNNTIVNANTTMEFQGTHSDMIARNNLLYNCGSVTWGSVSHDYNYYAASVYSAEANGINAGSVNPFVNLSGGDYHIVSTISATMPRNKGSTLAAPFTLDYEGHTRGEDGAWDIGAYEYGGVADSTPPTITLTAPTNGAAVSGSVAFTATAADNISVAGVRFYVSDSEVNDDTSAPYAYSWNSTVVTNGDYTVAAQARDGAGNTAWSATNTISVSNAVLALPTPSLYWTFNEGSGSTATDVIASKALTFRPGSGWTNSGKFGGALLLDGVTGRLDTPNGSEFTLTNAMTVAAWVNLQSTVDGWQQIAAKIFQAGSHVSPFYAWHLFGGPISGTQWSPKFQLVNTVSNSVLATSSVNANFNEWVHVAGVYDGANVRIYVNGVNRGSAAQTGNVIAFNQPFYVGCNAAPGGFVKGMVDDLRFYKTAFSDSEIARLYIATGSTNTINRPLPPAGLHVVGN